MRVYRYMPPSCKHEQTDSGSSSASSCERPALTLARPRAVAAAVGALSSASRQPEPTLASPTAPPSKASLRFILNDGDLNPTGSASSSSSSSSSSASPSGSYTSSDRHPGLDALRLSHDYRQEYGALRPEPALKKRRSRKASMPCEICHRTFGEAAALRKHRLAVHDKVKEHMCGLCEKSFAERSNLRKHMQARHAVDATPHPCTYPGCAKSFNFSDGLRRHVNNCHLNVRPFGCEVCNAKFKQRAHARKHMAAKHRGAMGGQAGPGPDADYEHDEDGHLEDYHHERDVDHDGDNDCERDMYHGDDHDDERDHGTSGLPGK
jgi:Zinc finger, C2H2 type/Zinc-finger of C2H2 type